MNMRFLSLHLIVLIFVLQGCEQSNPLQDKPLPTDTTMSEDSTLVLENEDMDAIYYVVIADTGKSYSKLLHTMQRISKHLNLPIDSMERRYDPKNNLIALPENHEDEIYAGAYYPRRDPSEHLSIEYYDFFAGTHPDKTMALVTGIYERESRADSALQSMQRECTSAFKLKSIIFVGCLH